MKVDNIAAILTQQNNHKPAAADAGPGSFAEMMAASVEASNDDAAEGAQTDMDFIRENGFAAYAKEVEKRKMEEMREEILARMGLSEEDLDKMPAEQRAAIEDLITQEIQRRMQANAEAEDDDKGGLAGMPDDARDIVDSGNTGSSGLAMLAVMEARDGATDLSADGNHLPSDEEESS